MHHNTNELSKAVFLVGFKPHSKEKTNEFNSDPPFLKIWILPCKLFIPPSRVGLIMCQTRVPLRLHSSKTAMFTMKTSAI